jgi:predicted DCC family thiol-disulfide oxidoreductase YuxK
MDNAVLLFDGVCNFCNSSVNFIMQRDPKGYFKFASLQSAYGQQQLLKAGLNTKEFDSLVLLENGRIYLRSSAALRIVRSLNGLWPLLYVFIIVPPFLRNFLYNIIARNRYRWFGKREECRVPTAEERGRFVV